MQYLTRPRGCTGTHKMRIFLCPQCEFLAFILKGAKGLKLEYSVRKKEGRNNGLDLRPCEKELLFDLKPFGKEIKKKTYILKMPLKYF